MSEAGGEPRPHLRAVSEEVPAAEPAAEASAAGEGSWLLWVAIGLGLAALACAVGWSLSAREGARLEAALERSQAELRASEVERLAAEQRLDAFAGHLSTARQRVGALLSGLGELEAFLASDPAAPGGSPPPAPPAP